ncbi:MAG: cupredoxin domain-containing protein [Bryobacteraceae bacterium]|jgi:cytochrome c oxidase subunit 2
MVYMGKLRAGLGIWAVLAAATLCSHAQETPSSAGAIKMTAVKYRFTPDVIKVKKGDRVRLVVTALDRDHGFKLEAFQIDKKLPKGEPVAVEFTADRAGTFPFQCSQFCGLGHKKMKGQLVVEP